jgi:hypothetical protein
VGTYHFVILDWIPDTAGPLSTKGTQARWELLILFCHLVGTGCRAIVEQRTTGQVGTPYFILSSWTGSLTLPVQCPPKDHRPGGNSLFYFVILDWIPDPAGPMSTKGPQARWEFLIFFVILDWIPDPARQLSTKGPQARWELLILFCPLGLDP